MRLLLLLVLFSSIAISEEKALTLKLESIEIKPLEKIQIEEKPEEIKVGVQFVLQL